VAHCGRVSTITATFKLTTPAFIGGANNKERAELRLPSVLGVLRFWWRALAWSATAQEGDEPARLEKLRQWEGELFGAAASGDGKGGQGRFIARLVSPLPQAATTPHDRYLHENPGYQQPTKGGWLKGSGRDYLAGQGLAGRKFLPAGSQFSLEFASRVGFGASGDGPVPSLIEALEVMGLLGCIGARTRRGFGSLRLGHLLVCGEEVQLPATGQDYRAALSFLLSKHSAAAALPAEVPYSALSSLTSVGCVEGRSAADLHDEMGHRLQYYRSYGQKKGAQRVVGGRLKGDPSFEDDHQWLGSVLNHFSDSSPPIGLVSPRRAIFGLPHNYFKRCDDGWNRAVHVTEPTRDRRASPLFLHIHAFDEKKERPVAVWTLMKSAFLPAAQGGPPDLAIKREESRGKGSEKKKAAFTDWSVGFHADYGAVEDFLNEQHLPGVVAIEPAPAP
jgi:CRISPR-associated protein Cmr1